MYVVHATKNCAQTSWGWIKIVLRELAENISEFVCGIKIDSKVSFSNLFFTNAKLLKDFIIEENDYEKTF